MMTGISHLTITRNGMFFRLIVPAGVCLYLTSST
jgi:hypothetical protein